MNKWWLLFIGALLCSGQGMAAQGELNPKIKNESSLRFLTTGVDVEGATLCSGILPSDTDDLAGVNISTDDLRKEVHCTVGDFDGNGYLDFAMWGNKKKERSPDYENYLVLFFEKSRIIRKLRIKVAVGGSLLVHYPPRLKPGPNDEPVSMNDALWAIGSTNGYDDVSKGTVYIFDPKTNGFKQTKFGDK